MLCQLEIKKERKKSVNKHGKSGKRYCNTIKLIVYWRFLVEIYNRKKIGESVLFIQLNNYHPNIKLDIELNPSKFI